MACVLAEAAAQDESAAVRKVIEARDRGSHLVHWQKVDGGWRIVADCPSSETPLPSQKQDFGRNRTSG